MNSTLCNPPRRSDIYYLSIRRTTQCKTPRAASFRQRKQANEVATASGRHKAINNKSWTTLITSWERMHRARLQACTLPPRGFLYVVPRVGRWTGSWIARSLDHSVLQLSYLIAMVNVTSRELSATWSAWDVIRMYCCTIMSCFESFLHRRNTHQIAEFNLQAVVSKQLLMSL